MSSVSSNADTCGVLGIVPNPKHIDTLCGLLGVAQQKPKQTPFPTGGTLPLWVQTTLDLKGIYRDAWHIAYWSDSLMHVCHKTLASFSSREA